MEQDSPQLVLVKATMATVNTACERLLGVAREALGFDPKRSAFEQMPEGFTVSSPAWTEIEDQIETYLLLDGSLPALTKVCREYERRALAYFAAWERRIYDISRTRKSDGRATPNAAQQNKNPGYRQVGKIPGRREIPRLPGRGPSSSASASLFD